MVVFEEALERGAHEQPQQIGHRAGEGQERGDLQDVPIGARVGQGKGRQRGDAKDDDLCVRQLHQQPREKVAVRACGGLARAVAAQDVPCHPEDVGRADPGQHAEIAVQHRAEEPDRGGGEQGHHGEADEDAAPLAQRLPPAVFHGGGQRAEVGGARRNGGNGAVENKGGDHGSRHD